MSLTSIEGRALVNFPHFRYESQAATTAVVCPDRSGRRLAAAGPSLFGLSRSQTTHPCPSWSGAVEKVTVLRGKRKADVMCGCAAALLTMLTQKPRLLEEVGTSRRRAVLEQMLLLLLRRRRPVVLKLGA